MDNFDRFELISSYSRVQAIEDGVLVDISHTSEVHESGFKISVCVTDRLWAKIRDTTIPWGDWHGRSWDVCTLATLWLCFNEHEVFTIMFPSFGEGDWGTNKT